jgi:alpha-D-ribose 1-methylphosphonate 5-phosphate C-P lyase
LEEKKSDKQSTLNTHGSHSEKKNAVEHKAATESKKEKTIIQTSHDIPELDIQGKKFVRDALIESTLF